MPSASELKSRFTHSPPRERDGRRAARACRTRASASSVRSVARATAGASPAASRTASPNESFKGCPAWGAWARKAGGATTRPHSTVTSRYLLFRDTMEIQVDVSVQVLLDVESFRHARRKRAQGHDGMHQG